MCIPHAVLPLPGLYFPPVWVCLGGGGRPGVCDHLGCPFPPRMWFLTSLLVYS